MKKTLISVIVIITAILSVMILKHLVAQPENHKVLPKNGQIIETIYGLGKVKSDQTYVIKLGIFSTVHKVYVKEGDDVKKGQKLISIDMGTNFNAPFDGKITQINVKDGETIGSQLPLLKLENLNSRYIELSLEQDSALKIKKGQKVRVGFESINGYTVAGFISSIYPRENEFIARINISELNDNILPGMSADVAIEIGTSQGLTIPLKAINNGFVTIERNGHKQKIKITPGLNDGLSVQIKDNSILDNDLIILPKD